MLMKNEHTYVRKKHYQKRCTHLYLRENLLDKD